MTASNTEEDFSYVASNYRLVQKRVAAAAAATNNHVRLVAVSKTKPLSAMKVAYDAGCRVFGENYVQEMIGKMEQWKKDDDDENNNNNNDKDSPSSQVQWHYIGSLQSNKCNALVKAIVAYSDIRQCTIETVSSIKLADKLNHAVQQQQQQQEPARLKVFVQVNTSGEDTKSGVTEIEQVIELCRHIVQACPYLELRGLMTIGAAGDERDFRTLVQCRDQVAQAFDAFVAAATEEPDTNATTITAPSLEMSMGMSGDFEVAIQAGSTNVRVGSTIFGERDYSQK
jgi:hypothetical protein